MRDHDPYGGGPALAGWAKLLADPTRATFCMAMLDGRIWTATQLARHAGVAASTASAHLDRLVAGGLLTEERRGRNRRVCLAGPDVATVIESMSVVAGHRPGEVRTLSAANRRRALAYARTCYDHLAGRLGVAVTDAMTVRGLLDLAAGPMLTDAGLAWFADLGVELAPRNRRPLVRACPDWTERRPHLAGLAGAALCEHAFRRHWVTRQRDSRAVTVTPDGRRAFARHLGLDPTG